MIEFQNVSYSYEDELVLNKINFKINRGECVAFCGANGAGKSTILKILNGIIFPIEGKFFLDDIEITKKLLDDNKFSKQFHQRIGFIWQNSDVQLFCSSVEEEISFGPRQMGLSEVEVKKRTDETIELLNLNKLRHRAPYYLSGGEKKKTAIASILTMNPEIWTLDEPLSSLDSKTQIWLTEFFQELKAAGKTILFSSHNSNFIETLADRKLCLNEDHTLT